MSSATPPPLPVPDAAGWTLAAGVSVSLHIGFAAALVLGLSGAPGAAPGPELQITLRSVPQIAGAGPEQTARLAATAPEARVKAQDDPTRPEFSAQPEALAALPPSQNLRPDQDLSAIEDLALERTAPTGTERRDSAASGSETPVPLAAPRLAALAPDRPVPAPQMRPSDRALPASPLDARSVQRLQPLTEAPLRATEPTPSTPTPARTRPLPPDAAPPPQRLQAEVSTSSPAAPQRLQAEVSTSSPAAPAPATRLRAEGLAPPPSDAALTARTQPSTRPPPDALRMAMQPPPQDTLERALRDRPRTFLSDRRAAPRPDRRNAADSAGLDAPDQPLHDAVRDHLLALPDITCFAAMPVLDDAGLLRVEVFGPGQAGLDDFRAGLESETGPIPGLMVQQVTQGQCETLDFIRRSRAYPAHDLYMQLSARRIDSGGRLLGEIHKPRGRAVALLLIDNAGRVQSLERFLTRDPDVTAFEIPMTLQGPPVETWQLLLAVATDSPLQTVTTLSGPQEAATVFARLRAELATRGLTPDLALTAFSLN